MVLSAQQRIDFVQKHGQSFWIDYLSRSFLSSPQGLQDFIVNKGVTGLTSNPAIFEKAIAQSNDYDQKIKNLKTELGLGNVITFDQAEKVYEELAIQDIQEACDILKPIYNRTKSVDGYASLEVSPKKAFNTEATISEAKNLWQRVNRKNLMIKIPGTPQGLPAIEECLYTGLNINVTLLFSLEAYKNVALCYARALKRRYDEGLSLDDIHSVASFFVSRIDSEVDSAVEKKTDWNQHLEYMGKAAIYNAKLAYEIFLQVFNGDSWNQLKHAGAVPQRLLWASTSTKNPRFSKTIYVDHLIAQNTVNTLPEATLNSFLEEGSPKDDFLNDVEGETHSPKKYFDMLKSKNIDIKTIQSHLLKNGVDLFEQAYDRLISALQKKLMQ